MIGLLYYKIKNDWRAWLRIIVLHLQTAWALTFNRKKQAKGVIVCITTIPSRIKSVEQTLKSILVGQCLPEMIYLYIDVSTYYKIKLKKSFISHLENKGLVKLKVVEDVRSYKKLIYALQEYSDKCIVTCDDDVLYPKYWLSSLLDVYYQKFDKKLIICHRAHEVTFDKYDKLLRYDEWIKESKSLLKSTSLLFPTGKGGVLYPPKSMPEITCNSNLFLEFAPTADDVWFWFCALSNGCSFIITNNSYNRKDFPEIPNSQSMNLWKINVVEGMNDIQIRSCINFFNTEFESSDKSRLLRINRLNNINVGDTTSVRH